MKRKENISLQLQSMYSFFNTSNLLPLIQLQTDMLPEYCPTKWGFDERYKYDFSMKSIVLNLSNPTDAPCLMWRRSGKDRANGAWSMRWTPARDDISFNHANVDITVYSTKYQKKILSYFTSLAAIAKTNFGCIEAYTEEYRTASFGNEGFVGGRVSICTHVLRHWLPDIYWATVFGPDYIKLFGMEHLLSTPAYRVEEISDDVIFIQLTPDMNDPFNYFDEVMNAREKVKNHLGQECFFHKDRAYNWYDHPKKSGKVYRVPTFTKIDDLSEFGDRIKHIPHLMGDVADK